MSDRRLAAERHMADAKRKFSAAAQAALAGDPNAVALANTAFQDVTSARAELAALDDKEVEHGAR